MNEEKRRKKFCLFSILVERLFVLMVYLCGGENMLNKREFLKEYNITEEEFHEAEMEWDELEAIYDNYKKIEDKLRKSGKNLSMIICMI